MWIKLCGIVRPTDFEFAAELGVDAIGIIAVPGTPRCLTAAEGKILSQLPRGSTKLTLVLQAPDISYAKEMISAVQPDLLQFHGNEKPSDAAQFGLPYIKAVRGVYRGAIEVLSEHSAAFGWLIDAPELNEDATNRLSFLREAHPRGRLIVAGGLNDTNVKRVLEQTKPWGVDVSRGIETSPRQKSHRLMKQFVEAVRHASI